MRVLDLICVLGVLFCVTIMFYFVLFYGLFCSR